MTAVRSACYALLPATFSIRSVRWLNLLRPFPSRHFDPFGTELL